MSGENRSEDKRTFFQLVTELPYLLGELIRAELELLRKELVHKLKGTGIGIALVALGLSLLGLVALMLVFSGVFALSLVMPLWAAGLVVAGLLLLVSLVIVAIGALMVRSTKSVVPQRTIDSVTEDIARIRGDRARAKESSRGA